MGLGTSGQLGHGEFTSQNLPVQAGASDTNTVKPAYLEILSGGAPRLTYSYNINNGTGNMAPDFLNMGLKEILSIDPAKVCLQLTDGFNLYKDGYRIGLPQGVTVSFRSGDDSIGVLRNVDANGVPTGSRVELVSADGKKTGTVTLYITVTYQDGSSVVGQLRVTFTNMAVKETEVMVSSGATHSVALAEDGSLWLWGSNNEGQLGDEIETPYYEYPHHLTVEENGAAVIFTAVEAGDSYTLAIDNTGVLWAWGKGYTAAPARVSDTEQFAQVDTYMDRIIGLTTGGQVYTWTAGASLPITGETGIVDLTDVGAVKQVAVGADHYMLLTTGGQVYAWGENTYGQLGVGVMAQANTVGVVSVNEAGTALVTTNENKNLLTVDPTAKTVPTAVVVDTYNVKNVLTQSGKTYTTVKEVTNTLTTVVKEPVMVQKVEDGKPVVDGDGNPVMVQKIDENGDPVFVDKTVPVEHAGVVMSGIVSISAGAYTSAAVRNDGAVYIWGRNDNYETASGDEDYVFEINEEETHIVTAGNEPACSPHRRRGRCHYRRQPCEPGHQPWCGCEEGRFCLGLGSEYQRADRYRR